MSASSGIGPRSSSLQIGAQIGPYQIHGLLGRGGMGAVYRAQHVSLGRLVALKVISGQADATAVARLQREAKAIALLDHPNIVRVFDSGLAPDGRSFVAMELLDGESFQTLLARNQLALPDRVRIVAEVARAIHHAHSQGIIHRDVKPGNVVVERTGRAKLLDFGVGKLADADVSRELTQAGTMLGTFAYMAPEQVRGTAVDARTDVYSLGATLYDAITGRTPLSVTTSSPATALYSILKTVPPPASEVAPPGTFGAGPPEPEALDAICARALAKRPTDRYESAAAMAADIERALAGEPISASSVRRRGRDARRASGVPAGIVVLLVLAGVVGAVAGTVAVVGVGRGGAPADATAATPSPPPRERPSVAERLRAQAELEQPGPPSPAPTAATPAEPPAAGPPAARPILSDPVIPDPPPPASPVELTPQRLTETTEACIAAGNARDHGAAILAYRALGIGGDLDRLGNALRGMDKREDAILWGWAIEERGIAGDEAGVERALAEFNRAIRRDLTPGTVPAVADLQARKTRHAIGRLSLAVRRNAIRGDPLEALSLLGDPKGLGGVPGHRNDPLVQALHDLANLRAFIPSAVRAVTTAGMSAEAIFELSTDPSRVRQMVEALTASTVESILRAPDEARRELATSLLEVTQATRALAAERLYRVRFGDGLGKRVLWASPPEAWHAHAEQLLCIGGPKGNADRAMFSRGEVQMHVRQPARFARIELDLQANDAALVVLAVGEAGAPRACAVVPATGEGRADDGALLERGLLADAFDRWAANPGAPLHELTAAFELGWIDGEISLRPLRDGVPVLNEPVRVAAPPAGVRDLTAILHVSPGVVVREARLVLPPR